VWPNRNEIVWEKVEELKQEYCYVAEDYHAELSIFQVLLFSFLELTFVLLNSFDCGCHHLRSGYVICAAGFVS
jgi:hypothetical protein